MPLGNIFPTLPWPLLEIVITVVAGLGAILLTYAIFLESERHQDATITVGAGCLLVYALWIGNKIFTVAMAGIMIGAFIELLEILFGRHIHSKELIEEYEHPCGDEETPKP